MPFRRLRLSRLSLLLGALLLAPAAPTQSALAPGGYRWLEAGPWDGPIYMVVSIDRQMVHVYSGDRLIGMARVSTGMAGHRTPTGDYPILQKRQWHRSNLYSNAPMPFMQRLTWDGIALHAGHDPGYPASHGCIRLPYGFARALFAITRIGTPVEVTADRLRPALKLDPLVLGDPETRVVGFSSGAVPMLEVDPAIFRVQPASAERRIE